VSVDGSRTFLVRSELQNPDWRYAPGMSIRMQLTLDEDAGIPRLQVPADAISRRVDGATVVWVARESDDRVTVQPVAVTLGGRSGNAIEITGGDLKAGDRVVTRGNETLAPGQFVTIAPRKSASGLVDGP
jgi:membrane fusion protein (multidrug efflux system)